MANQSGIVSEKAVHQPTSSLYSASLIRVSIVGAPTPHRFGGDTLRLVVNDPDVLVRLTEVFGEARVKLVQHLYAKAHPDRRWSRWTGR